MVKKKILLLNIITLLPVVIFVIFLNIKNLNLAKTNSQEEIKDIAKIVSLENKRVIESVRQLLLSFSVLPELNYGKGSCSTFLSNALSKYQRYGNFGVTDKSGNLICSAIKITENINLSDRYFFDETFRTNDFTVGEYVVSRATKKSSINFGYPLVTNTGLVYATLDLRWLNDFIDQIAVDENIVILLLDKNGIILSRSPNNEDVIGQQFLNTEGISNLNGENGIFETVGVDNVLRIYAYEKINTGNDNNLYVLVGKSKAEVLNSVNKGFINQLSVSVLIIIASLIAGFLIGNSLIKNTIDKLKEIENLRQDFISLVSHQLRTPATSIKWFIEILLNDRKNKLDKKQKSILKDSYSSIKRMIELISNVLSITKLESGKFKIEKVKVNIYKAVKLVLKNVNKEFKGKNIKNNVTIRNKNQTVSTDEKLLYQAIYNLIHNAFKYTKNGGKVRINIQKDKSKIIIKISDNGIGIPENEKNNIFNKFSRATNAKLVDTEGAGLGLYLSELIIKAHGGNIKLGQQKTGTLVLVTIPLS